MNAPTSERPATSRRLAAAFALAALSALAAEAAPHAHDHGAAQLQVALDGPLLTLTLRAPMDGVAGFERAPRNAAERQALADALARLRDAATLYQPDAAAQCQLERAQAPDPFAAGRRAGAGADHADVEAEAVFRCAQPALLRALEVRLLESFPRFKRVEALVATPQGQRKFMLRRPARTLKLQR
jgi:hypothetical protein